MDDLISLDVITWTKRHQRSLHFVAVGASTRFWIHFDAASLDIRSYLRFLCGMLPKKNLRTLRFSMENIDDFVLIRDTMLDPLPSLDTLFVRHSKVASPVYASVGIAAVSRVLCPGGAPEHDTSHTESHSDSEVSSDGFSDTDSDPYSDTDSDDVNHLGHPFDATGQSLDTPHNHDSHADFPIDISGKFPAPQLKVVGLEVKCATTTSLKSFVRMVEARKQSGHPLDTVLCSLKSVDTSDVDDMKEHVVDGVRDVGDSLWVPTIDKGWLVKNDYWRLYPEPREDYEDDCAIQWGFNLRTW